MKFRLTIITLLSLLFTSTFFNVLHIEALERAEQQKQLEEQYYKTIVNNLMIRVCQIEN